MHFLQGTELGKESIKQVFFFFFLHVGSVPAVVTAVICRLRPRSAGKSRWSTVVLYPVLIKVTVLMYYIGNSSDDANKVIRPGNLMIFILTSLALIDMILCRPLQDKLS